MLYVSSSVDGSNGLTAEKFNKWYNGKHISELLQVPGLNTAIRYVSITNLLLKNLLCWRACLLLFFPLSSNRRLGLRACSVLKCEFLKYEYEIGLEYKYMSES